MDLQSVIDPGRTFHSLGEAMLKAQTPKPLVLLWGTANWLEMAECNVQTVLLSWSISVIYSGAWSCKTWYTWIHTLKSILISIWSQCNDFSTGVIRSNLVVLGNNLAAAFRICLIRLKLKTLTKIWYLRIEICYSWRHGRDLTEAMWCKEMHNNNT